MRKTCSNASEALNGFLFNGMTIAVGGFGLCGIPELLIGAVWESKLTDIVLVSNDGGTDDFGIGPLLSSGRCRKLIASYIGSNPALAELYLRGKIQIELSPQGTLAERMRAGGAGIPGFYTATGFGTDVAAGKEVKNFNGRSCILETAIRADLALVKAWRADASGNLVFRKTARNFNPIAASCAKVCIAEVEEIVADGLIDADMVHLPGIYVHRLFAGEHEKRIEQRTVRSKHLHLSTAEQPR